MGAKKIDRSSELTFYTLGTIAKRLDCSRKTVERKIREGKLQPKVIDGKRKISHANLVEYLHKYGDADFE